MPMGRSGENCGYAITKYMTIENNALIPLSIVRHIMKELLVIIVE